MTAELSGTQLAALRARLEEALGRPLAAPLQAGLLSGGRSNLTYLVTSGSEKWVLRRPPLGHVLESAHDMSREYRVIGALQGTAVPVPGSVLYHRDPGLLGADFYVMELVDGRVLRTGQDLTALSRPDRRALAEGLIDTLAALHAVDYRQVGLATLGRPAGYLQRQLDRWQRQLAASRSRTVPGLAESARGWPSTRRRARGRPWCTATTVWTTSFSRRRRPVGYWLSWTGRWPPSATR